MNGPHGLRANFPCHRCVIAPAIALAIVAILARPLSVAGSETPLTLVKQLVAQVLAVVKDNRMAQAAKEKRLRELGAANFDFAEMSRLAMGHSWPSLSTDQHRRFVSAFTSFLEDAYLNKIQNYSNQNIQISGARMFGKERAQVNGRVAQPGVEPITLRFSLRRAGGAWKIYDVALDNVSTLGNYRTQFQRIMREKGFDELLAQIRQRDRELASTLGSPSGLPF